MQTVVVINYNFSSILFVISILKFSSLSGNKHHGIDKQLLKNLLIGAIIGAHLFVNPKINMKSH